MGWLESRFVGLENARKLREWLAKFEDGRLIDSKVLVNCKGLVEDDVWLDGFVSWFGHFE